VLLLTRQRPSRVSRRPAAVRVRPRPVWAPSGATPLLWAPPTSARQPSRRCWRPAWASARRPPAPRCPTRSKRICSCCTAGLSIPVDSRRPLFPTSSTASSTTCVSLRCPMRGKSRDCRPCSAASPPSVTPTSATTTRARWKLTMMRDTAAENLRSLITHVSMIFLLLYLTFFKS
jgi:hypothetical protein